MFLLENLDVEHSRLIDYLFSDQVVSVDETGDIRAEGTSFRANEKPLSVLSCKCPQQFQLFLDALDNCGQQHVRNKVTDRQPGLSTPRVNKANKSNSLHQHTHTHTHTDHDTSVMLLINVYVD